MNASNVHEQAEVLLPWFVTDRLDENDRALLEAHLEGCAECRRHVEAERRLALAWKAVRPEQSDGLRRLRQRISADTRLARRHAAGRWRDVGKWWAQPGVAWAAALPLVLLLALQLYFTSLTSPAYRTLGDRANSSANLIILFRPETSEADMRRALRRSGATLVGGPTSSDAYLLHVDSKRRAAALAGLDANGDVLMVEPINDASR
jgi:hypothetical protein